VAPRRNSPTIVQPKKGDPGGWFYFAGELVEAGVRLTDAGPGFQYFFTDAQRLPSATVDFGNSVLAVEFVTKLPWVIEARP
jgi:hypothetical protein